MDKNYKITLKDGTEFDVLNVIGKSKSIRGTVRDSLTFNFEFEDYPTDDVCAAFSNAENTSEIKIISISSGESYSHCDYSIMDCVSLVDEVVSKETSDEPECKIRVLSVVMGQKTYSEKQEDIRNEMVDNVSEVIADLLGGAL